MYRYRLYNYYYKYYVTSISLINQVNVVLCSVDHLRCSKTALLVFDISGTLVFECRDSNHFTAAMAYIIMCYYSLCSK